MTTGKINQIAIGLLTGFPRTPRVGAEVARQEMDSPTQLLNRTGLRRSESRQTSLSGKGSAFRRTRWLGARRLKPKPTQETRSPATDPVETPLGARSLEPPSEPPGAVLPHFREEKTRNWSVGEQIAVRTLGSRTPERSGGRGRAARSRALLLSFSSVFSFMLAKQSKATHLENWFFFPLPALLSRPRERSVKSSALLS